MKLPHPLGRGLYYYVSVLFIWPDRNMILFFPTCMQHDKSVHEMEPFLKHASDAYWGIEKFHIDLSCNKICTLVYLAMM